MLATLVHVAGVAAGTIATGSAARVTLGELRGRRGDDRVLVIAVTALGLVRVRVLVVVVVQVVHDDVHRHRRAEEREDDEGEEAYGRARHHESAGAKPDLEVYSGPCFLLSPPQRSSPT